MPVDVPFSNDPAQSFTCTLGGVRYAIDARWNDRIGVWTFDLSRDADQVVLLAGVPLLLGQDVLQPYALGIGGMVGTDLSGAGVDATVDDLGCPNQDGTVPDGVRVIFSYLTEDELVVARGPG